MGILNFLSVKTLVENFKRSLNRPVLLFKKSFKIKFILVVCLLSIVFLFVFGFTYLYFKDRARLINTAQEQKNESPTMPPVGLIDKRTVDVLDVNATIKIPFLRNGEIYLYEDGVEKIVARPTEVTNDGSKCFSIIYPMISPNGKFIAYLDQYGEESGMYGCIDGTVRIVDIANSVDYVSHLKSDYASFTWNNDNSLTLIGTSENGNFEYMLYDPNERKVVNRLNTNAEVKYVYPFVNNDKFVSFENGVFYLNEFKNRTKLFNENDVNYFAGWSPDGKYILFVSKEKLPPEYEDSFSKIFYVLDSENLSQPKRKVTVYSGGGGGALGFGLQWFFNEGFIAYCSIHLTYVDQREPRLLGRSGGGGCNNEKGFVATSPDGKYALINVRTEDELRLEFYEQGKKVKDILTGLKGGLSEIRWINNDYALMFENSFHQPLGNTNSYRVYIFDRKEGEFKLIMNEGYLY